MDKGIIFKIQRSCTDDGPGIRTTVFLKGCPLKCLWCHNPESQSLKTQLFYNPNLCIGCGKCVEACPNSCHSMDQNGHLLKRDECTVCGNCISPSCNALSLMGYSVSAEDVMAEVMKDEAFYKSSGGGITLSGGEPLLQLDFSLQLLKAAKENGIGTCIETCAYADSEELLKLIPFVDIFLLDFKETDSQAHKEFTGVGNELIIKNIHLIDEKGGKIIIRCPIIPNCNDTDKHFKGIADLANSLQNVIGINLEPYHSFGTDKYSYVGRKYALNDISVPDDAQKFSWTEKLRNLTSVPVKCL